MIVTIWKKLKENFTVFLAIATTVVTLLYAALKLIIYVYWTGYFRKLSIDNSFINLSFDGFIFQVIFFGIILLMIIYLMTIVDDCFKHNKNKMWNKNKNFWNKLGSIIKIGLADFVISILVLALGNVPLAIVILVLSQQEIAILNVVIYLILLYIMEMLLLGAGHLYTTKPSDNKRSLEKKIGDIIFKTLVYVCFFLATIYYTGYQSIETKNTIRVVENGNYGITYCDREIYILHKIKIEENKLIIYRDEQKIISIDNCEYAVQHVEEVEIY